MAKNNAGIVVLAHLRPFKPCGIMCGKCRAKEAIIEITLPELDVILFGCNECTTRLFGAERMPPRGAQINSTTRGDA